MASRRFGQAPDQLVNPILSGFQGQSSKTVHIRFGVWRRLCPARRLQPGIDLSNIRRRRSDKLSLKKRHLHWQSLARKSPREWLHFPGIGMAWPTQLNPLCIPLLRETWSNTATVAVSGSFTGLQASPVRVFAWDKHFQVIPMLARISKSVIPLLK